MVFPALLDANARCVTNLIFLLEPTTSNANLILKARVIVNDTSVAMLLLIANISSALVIIKKMMPAVN